MPTTKRLIALLPSPPAHWVGDGFPVRSIFSYHDPQADLSPFLLLDYAEPTYFPPSEAPRGVEVHPHRGFETVTIVYQGSLAHRDSSGGGGRIGPGDVQWMTAGSGIVHEEFHAPEFAAAGGTLEMVQLWVNLPAKHKKAAPGYQAIESADIPEIDLPGGASARVIAGALNGATGPARTFTPIDLWDVRFRAGAKVALPFPAGHTAGILVLRGALKIGEKLAGSGDFAVLTRENEMGEIEATEDATALVLGGEPIDEPVVGAGPFVMNTREEIAQAMDDYRQGRMGEIRG